MRPLSPRTRRRLVAQGYTDLPDWFLVAVNPWLRLAPALCLMWVATSAWKASPWGFFALVPFAAVGALLPSHPFEAIYNHGIRHMIGTPVEMDPDTRRESAPRLHIDPALASKLETGTRG